MASLDERAVSDGGRGERGRSTVRRLLQGAAVAAVVGLLALLTWRLVSSRDGSQLVSAIKAGRKPAAPGFVLSVVWPASETWPKALLSALADGKVSLSELRGHPVVINFWASWCIPCKVEAPHFAASARAHTGRVVFLGVDVQDFKSDARDFARRYGMDYVSVRDGTDDTYSRYGLTGVPETYYLDSRGRVVAHSPGAVSRAELEDRIATIATPAAGNTR